MEEAPILKRGWKMNAVCSHVRCAFVRFPFSLRYFCSDLRHWFYKAVFSTDGELCSNLLQLRLVHTNPGLPNQYELSLS
ncbi:unnamed protein product [Cylicocyclus nassatus]|uniref:Uncharacterized protein n=1 Tax=Cylicocyclus nassatus TaxID=53992 RepID=A0AA36GNT9_CYLNA|nr:unnamed protein product [Cylicocyclus nassatus]